MGSGWATICLVRKAQRARKSLLASHCLRFRMSHPDRFCFVFALASVNHILSFIGQRGQGLTCNFTAHKYSVRILTLNYQSQGHMRICRTLYLKISGLPVRLPVIFKFFSSFFRYKVDIGAFGGGLRSLSAFSLLKSYN